MTARRKWAWPPVPLYAAALAAQDALRSLGVLGTRRLEWPVISVGSLSAGGAGKTPVVIALAGLLRARGWTVNVLSRGYQREGREVEQVYPGGAGAAARYGDEPVLIAQRAGVPVWVAAKRFAAGTAAERESAWVKPEAMRSEPPGRVHLLDDGFQHRELARSLDVVLVTEEDLDDALLPAGNRREPLRALRRADAVVLREEERDRVLPRVRERMRVGAAVWTIRRELHFPKTHGELCGGARPLAFCAIARPAGFWEMLAKSDVDVAKKVAFGDHHGYKAEDIDRLVKIAADCGATGFVTTEKDAVKLTSPMLERLQTIGPLCVAGLDVKFVDEAEVMWSVEARCR